MRHRHLEIVGGRVHEDRPFPRLSIDVSGEWSPRQARAVQDALREELRSQGLRLVPIDSSRRDLNRCFLILEWNDDFYPTRR